MALKKATSGAAILPIEIEPISFEEKWADFVPWSTLKSKWPLKAGLLNVYDARAQERHIELIQQYYESRELPAALDVCKALNEYSKAMGALLLEWLRSDNQPCDREFMDD